MHSKTYTSAKPFVKWVGGKTQLLEDIRRSFTIGLFTKEGHRLCRTFCGRRCRVIWIIH